MFRNGMNKQSIEIKHDKRGAVQKDKGQAKSSSRILYNNIISLRIANDKQHR